MRDEYVDLSEISDHLREFRKKDNPYHDPTDPVKKFRTYPRSEIDDDLNLKGSSAVARRELEIEEMVSSLTGSPFKLGTKDVTWQYTIDEVYFMINASYAMAEMRKINRPKATVKRLNCGTFIVAVANQKGGVGKTTTSINIAVGMSIDEFSQQKILVVDLDPQGNLAFYTDGKYRNIMDTKTVSKYLSFKYEDEIKNEFNGDRKEFIKRKLISESIIPNLDHCVAMSDDTVYNEFLSELHQKSEGDETIPGTEDYLGFNVYKLLDEQFLDYIKEDYDVIIFDVSPHNSYAVHSVCYAVDQITIPVPPRQLDLDSTGTFVFHLEEIFSDFNAFFEHKGLRYLDFLRTMSKENTRESTKLNTKIKTAFRSRVLDTIIPDHSTFSKLATGYETIFSPATKSDYVRLEEFQNNFKALAQTINERIATTYPFIERQLQVEEHIRLFEETVEKLKLDPDYLRVNWLEREQREAMAIYELDEEEGVL